MPLNNPPCLRDLAVRDPRHPNRHAAEAEPLISYAIARRGPTYLRSHVFDLTTLMGTYVCMNEPERAVRIAHQALDQVEKVHSARVADRLQATAALATRRFPGVHALREIDQQIRTTYPKQSE